MTEMSYTKTKAIGIIPMAPRLDIFSCLPATLPIPHTGTGGLSPGP